MPESIRPVQVVVAYEFSPSAEAALERAVEVACRAPQHVLHVLAAIDSRHGMPIAPTNHVTYEYAEQIQRMVSERIKSLFTGRASASEVQFFVHARIGRPADEILKLAEEVGADLVFIGSNGRTGVERVVLGSVSERVVREAKCPVLVARPRTYKDVPLEHVIKYDHDRKSYAPPHRYTYVNNQVINRPNDWPLG